MIWCWFQEKLNSCSYPLLTTAHRLTLLCPHFWKISIHGMTGLGGQRCWWASEFWPKTVIKQTKQLYSLLPLTRPNWQALHRALNLKEVVNKLCDVMFGWSKVINKKLAELSFNVLTLKIMNRYGFTHLPIDDMRHGKTALTKLKTYWTQNSANKDPRPYFPVVEICQAEHFIYFSRQEN